MNRPTVASSWRAAMVQQALFLDDLSVDTPVDETPVPPGDFSRFWDLYRKCFLSKGAISWHAAHRQHFLRQSMTQGSLSVSEYHQKNFVEPGVVRDGIPQWPRVEIWDSTLRSVDAHFFFAGLSNLIRSRLINDYSSCCDPRSMHLWDIDALYTAARDVEMSPLYLEAQALAQSVGAVGSANHPVASVAQPSPLQSSPAARTLAKKERYRLLEEYRAHQRKRKVVPGSSGVTYSKFVVRPSGRIEFEQSTLR